MKLRALILVTTLLPLITFAAPGGIGSSLQKGLVGHWPLTGESEKVGEEILTNENFENGTTDWETQNFSVLSDSSVLKSGQNSYKFHKTSWDWGAIYQTIPNASSFVGKTIVYSIWMRGNPGNPNNTDYITGFPHIHTNLDTDGFRWTATNGSNTTAGITKERFLSDKWHKYEGKYTVESGVTLMEFVVAPLWIGKNPVALNTDFPGFYIDQTSFKILESADTTPYDNHGTIYGATSTTGPHGETDGAMSFDGVDDFINADVDTNLTNVTIASWIYVDSSSSTYQVAQALGGASTTIDIACKPSDSKKCGCDFYNAVTNPVDIGYQSWTHIACSYDGTIMTQYINGIESATEAGAGKTFNSTHYIGVGRDGTSYDFNGKMSDTRIYNRTLSPEEVTQLYNEGGKTTVTQKPSLETGLVGHWALNGESEVWTALNGDSWQNSTAYGRVDETNYFSQNGNTIEVITTGSSWFGAGKMYATSEKGKYKIHIKTNLLNGRVIPAFHLYKDGTRVTYTAAQVPTTTTFTGNHSSGFNYGEKSALGIYETTDIIDLTNAPDFDAIHVALLSYEGTASPYLEFQNTDIFVKQLVTADSTPYDNHGKIDGATLTAGPNGETNGAMGFDGMNDFIDCGTDSILDNEEALSVSAWIKTSYDAPFPGEIGLVKKGTGGTAGWSSPGWSFRLRDDIPAFALRKKDDTGYWDLYSGTPVIDGKWHHIVGTFDTTSIRKYVDGTQTQMTSTGQPYLVSNGNCNIGKITNLFNGSISNVRIYNRVLSPEEVTQLYEEKAKIVGNKVPSLLGTGLIGHWPLSGGYTNPTIFADITPYDNHGTFTGTTLTMGINGEAGGARSFNGIGDFIDLGAIPSLTNLNEFTASTWINATKFTDEGAFTGWGIIGNAQWNGGGYHMGIMKNGTFNFVVNATGSSNGISIPTSGYNTNEWLQISMTYKDNVLKAYINGEYKDQNINATLGTTLNHFYIGDSPQGGWMPFPGSIADARIYNRALSADEVKRLYEVR